MAIVGGGLCGLALAERLAARGLTVRLFEARERVGGRALSEAGPDGARYDLGPAWIWPQNRRALAAAERFKLSIFEQFAQGALVFQDERGAVQTYDFSTMAGSLRIDGGVGALAEAIAATLPADCVALGAAVASVAATPGGVVLSGDGLRCDAERIVFATPPRIAARVAFAPGLPDSAQAALAAPPTWMAGHAKIIALYGAPFWRAAGLSGDGVSRRGPLAEIHDASAPAGGGALFGFVGASPAQRARDPDALKAAAIAQLAEMFGPAAGAPQAVLYKDWALDAETATAEDATPLGAHPDYRPDERLIGHWDGRLIFAGSELATTDGGFIEGAFAAAEDAARALQAAA